MRSQASDWNDFIGKIAHGVPIASAVLVGAKSLQTL
jgi:hypothetical protein